MRAAIAHDHGDDLQGFGDLEHAGFRVVVGKLSGITGKKNEGKDKNGARESQITSAGGAVKRHVNGGERHDHLVDIVVKCAEKLSPQETFEASVAEQRSITRSVFCGFHVLGTSSRTAHVIKGAPLT